MEAEQKLTDEQRQAIENHQAYANDLRIALDVLLMPHDQSVVLQVAVQHIRDTVLGAAMSTGDDKFIVWVQREMDRCHKEFQEAKEKGLVKNQQAPQPAQ